MSNIEPQNIEPQNIEYTATRSSAYRMIPFQVGADAYSVTPRARVIRQKRGAACAFVFVLNEPQPRCHAVSVGCFKGGGNYAAILY